MLDVSGVLVVGVMCLEDGEFVIGVVGFWVFCGDVFVGEDDFWYMGLNMKVMIVVFVV